MLCSLPPAAVGLFSRGPFSAREMPFEKHLQSVKVTIIKCKNFITAQESWSECVKLTRRRIDKFLVTYRPQNCKKTISTTLTNLSLHVSIHLCIPCWNFKTIYGGQEPSKNRVVVPTPSGYIAWRKWFLESILRLLKSLKIRAQIALFSQGQYSRNGFITYPFYLL